NFNAARGFMLNGSLQNNAIFNANISATATVTGSTSGGTNIFNNAGTFTKQGSPTLTFSNVSFNNSNSVNIQAGTLALLGGGTQTGDFSGPTGTTLQLGGTHSF